MLLGAAGRIPGDWRNITPKALQDASTDGFTSVNIIVDNPYEIESSDIMDLKSMFSDAGMVIGQTNGQYGGTLISADEQERRAAIEFASKMCHITHQLEAPNTYLRPGSINPQGPWLPHPENRSPIVFDRIVDSARRICRTAQDMGVNVAVEGGAVSPLFSARRVRDFIDAVGSRTLGFNQDPVNFVSSLEDAYEMQRFLGEFFDILGEVTLGAHVKDFQVVDQLMVRFEETDIGNGLLDHEMFLRGMQRVCPEAHILIEHLPSKGFASAANEYRQIASRAGIVWNEVQKR